MPAPKQSAKAAARHRSDMDVWIDHARIVESDEEWLREVQRLTLWNVQFPEGFLSRLKSLRWLDVRGGAAGQLDYLRDCPHLEMLVVNQVRGLSRLDEIGDLVELRFLSLYGLPKLASAPSLSNLHNLQRLELGSLKGLESIAPFLQAPNLRELLLLRKMGPGSVDAQPINNHPTLEAFDWFADGVPIGTWLPVTGAVKLPKARSMHPEAWFAAQQVLSRVPRGAAAIFR